MWCPSVVRAGRNTGGDDELSLDSMESLLAPMQKKGAEVRDEADNEQKKTKQRQGRP